MVRLATDRPVSQSRWLLVVIPFAGAIHCFAFLTITNSPSPDAQEYLALGKSLATAGELVLPTGEKAKRMPLYPALIAAVYRFSGEDHLERSVLALQCMLAVASTLFIALTARQICDPRAGLIAGLVSALYAPFLYLQSLCLTETPLIFFLSLAVLIYVRWISGVVVWRRSALFATSMLFAFAALTRANAVILLAPVAMDAALRAAGWRDRLGRILTLLLPTILCLSAWGWRNQREIGALTLSTTGGLNFYLGHNAGYAEDPGLGRADYAVFDWLGAQGHGEVEADRLLFEKGMAFARENPGATVVNTLRKLIVYHRAGVTDSAPSLVLIGFAAIVLAGRRSRAGPASRQRLVIGIVQIGLTITAVFWLLIFLGTNRPWTNPSHLVPIGLCALMLLRSQPRVRGLFIGLYAAEMLTALAFIPLARLRWTVDGLLIIAVAVGVSNVCRWLKREEAGRGGHNAGDLPV